MGRSQSFNIERGTIVEFCFLIQRDMQYLFTVFHCRGELGAEIGVRRSFAFIVLLPQTAREQRIIRRNSTNIIANGTLSMQRIEIWSQTGDRQTQLSAGFEGRNILLINFHEVCDIRTCRCCSLSRAGTTVLAGASRKHTSGAQCSTTCEQGAAVQSGVSFHERILSITDKRTV